jgi:hypothetical protein
MAVIANHLYRGVARAADRFLEVRKVVQVDGTRVRLTCPERGKLRVLLFEAGDMRVDQVLAIGGFQIAVAVRATGIRDFRKAHFSRMLGVAGNAAGREGLALIVRRPVVASQARFVRYRRPVVGRAQVAEVAVCREHRVGCGQGTFCVNTLGAENSRVDYPTRPEKR